jgi:hypothetical protein
VQLSVRHLETEVASPASDPERLARAAAADIHGERKLGPKLALAGIRADLLHRPPIEKT